jgi:hypothetical protein
MAGGYNLQQSFSQQTYANVISALKTEISILDLSQAPDLSNLIMEVTPKLLNIGQSIGNIFQDYSQSVTNQSSTVPLSEEDKLYDLNNDGFLDEEESKQKQKQTTINNFTSSLDNIYFSKFNFTTKDLINFKELSRKDRKTVIEKYIISQATGSSQYQNVSSSINTIDNIIDINIRAGEALFKILRKTITVKGYVYDSSTNEPIRGATVRFTPSNDEIFDYYTDRTNRKGKFSIEIPRLAEGILSDLPQPPITNNPQLVTIDGTVYIPPTVDYHGFEVYVSDEIGNPTTPLYQQNMQGRSLSEIQTTLNQVGQTISQTENLRKIPGFKNFSIPQDSKYITAKKIGTNLKQILNNSGFVVSLKNGLIFLLYPCIYRQLYGILVRFYP